MNETCKSCGTIFDLDEKTMTNKVHWLKCSVCNEKWSVFHTDSIISPEKNKEDDPLANRHDKEFNKVKNELASIKLVVENKSKQMSSLNNPILELKNKSVAEIAAELSASKLKTNNLNRTEPLDQKKNLHHSEKNNIKKARLSPLIIVLSFLVIGAAVFYRSPILAYSYVYFPAFTQKHEDKINNFFDFIRLPIFAELNHIKIVDFAATFQKNDVKFLGVLKNNSLRPIVSPKIRVLAVTEDGKILVKKIISMNEKILMPSSKIEFYDMVNLSFKKENISVRAIILKEIFKY